MKENAKEGELTGELGWDSIIIRYSSEIGIKGKNRSDFENRLISNVRDALREEHLKKVIIKKKLSRIIITDKTTDRIKELNIALKKLKYVFGISSFSMAKSCSLNIDEIIKEAKRIFFYYYKKRRFKTFRISTKRINKGFGLNSQRINEVVGEAILKIIKERKLDKKISVNLKKPDFRVGIEILNRAYLFIDRTEGLEGLPYGIEGAGIINTNNGSEKEILLSCFLMMKRGIKPVLIGDKKIAERMANKLRIFSHNNISCYNKEGEIPPRIKDRSIKISIISFNDLLTGLSENTKRIMELKDKEKNIFLPLLSYGNFLREQERRMINLIRQKSNNKENNKSIL